MKIIINTDGGCRGNAKDGEASAAFIARTEDNGYVGSRSVQLMGTNNIAEYRGVQLALEAVAAMVPKAREVFDCYDEGIMLEIRSDSQLIVKQLNGQYLTRDPDMRRMCRECHETLQALGFPFTVVWVPREQNKEADYLCGLALNGKVKTDLFSALPCHNKGAKATCGQLFQQHGQLTTPRPMRADSEGYALCNGCGARLTQCTCPPLAQLDVDPPSADPFVTDLSEVDLAWDDVA